MTIKPRSLKICKNCRDWSDCAGGKEHFTMQEIVYCRWQVMWIISQFLDVDSDRLEVVRDTWPMPESGYTEAPPTQHSVSPHAPFERLRQVTGDVMSRLKKTGKDGRLLVLEIHHGVGYLDLSTDARWALGYVSGFRAKRQSFSQWKYEKTHRKPDKKSVSTIPS